MNSRTCSSVNDPPKSALKSLFADDAHGICQPMRRL
jgi:hypothetical protein